MSETPDPNKRKYVIRDPATNVPFLWNAQDWPTTLNISGYTRGRLNLENFVRGLPGWVAPTDIQAGVYQVANVNSNKCLDVLGGSTANNAAVQQNTCGTGNNQKWQIESLGAGLYKLKAVHSGRLLSIGQSNMANGAKTIQWDDGTYIDQKWAIQASGSSYKLVVSHSGKCLDVSNGSTANGLQLQQWTCDGTIAQQFKLKALF